METARQNTPLRILNAARELFNEQGVPTTPLRQIAAKAGMTIGNLTYHFPSRDLITEALFLEMEEQRRSLLSSVKQAPTFEHIHATILPILQLNQKYRFFFAEPMEVQRHYPELSALQQRYIKKHIAYIRSMLDYSVGVGNVQPEPFPEAYQHLAERVWMMLHFWMLQESVRGRSVHKPEAARQAMWEMVYPHFTEKGRKKYSALYPKVAV